MSTQETTDEANSFNNENVKVIVTKTPGSRVKFDITANATAIEAAYAQALKNVRKEVSIPGFRKGKAPDNFILSNYPDAVDKEWKDVALDTAFREAMTLSDVYPIREAHMSRPVVHEFSKEKGLSFTIEFEVAPIIPTIDLENIKLPAVASYEITEKDEKVALHNLRLRFATYEDVIDRAAQEGDFVRLNLDLMNDGQAQRVIDNQRIQLTNEEAPIWLSKKVLGLNIGETAEGETEQGPNENDEDFKPIPFRVTLNLIQEGQLPELDDELAKKAGLENLEELKQKIAERIKEDVRQEAENKQKQQLTAYLLTHYSFEIPRSIIEKNIQTVVENRLAQLKSQGTQPTSAQMKQLVSSVENSIGDQLKLSFLMRKVMEDNNIEVTQEDINNELNEQIRLMSSGASTLSLNAGQEAIAEQLNNLAYDRKIKQFLLDKVVFINE